MGVRSRLVDRARAIGHGVVVALVDGSMVARTAQGAGSVSAGYWMARAEADDRVYRLDAGTTESRAPLPESEVSPGDRSGRADSTRGLKHRAWRTAIRMAGFDPGQLERASEAAEIAYEDTFGERPAVKVYIGDALIFDKRKGGP